MDDDFDEMEINLYLGNYETACNIDFLQKYEIKRVLSALQEQINKKSKIKGIVYKHISLWDDEREDIISYFPECCDFIFDGQLNGN